MYKYIYVFFAAGRIFIKNYGYICQVRQNVQHLTPNL